MTTYAVNVYRDDRWWMLRIPALDDYDGGKWPGEGLTQARRYTDIEQEARDYITTVTGSDDFDITVTAELDGLDLEAIHAELVADRAAVEELQARIERRQREVSERLREAAVPVRDIGAVLGVSYQRAHRLVSG